MQVTLVRPSDLGESEAAQWRAFQSSSLMMSHPFLSLSYVKAWGEVNANARVTVVEDDGQVVAFIPYEIGDGKTASTLGGPHTPMDGVVSSGAPLDMRAIVKSRACAAGVSYGQQLTKRRLIHIDTVACATGDQSRISIYPRVTISIYQT